MGAGIGGLRALGHRALAPSPFANRGARRRERQRAGAARGADEDDGARRVKRLGARAGCGDGVVARRLQQGRRAARRRGQGDALGPAMARPTVGAGGAAATSRVDGLVCFLSVPGAHREHRFGQRSTGCSTPVGHGGQ